MTDLFNDEVIITCIRSSNAKPMDEIQHLFGINNDNKNFSSSISFQDNCYSQINTNLYSNINTDIDFEQGCSMTNIHNLNDISFLDRDTITLFNACEPGYKSSVFFLEKPSEKDKYEKPTINVKGTKSSKGFTTKQFLIYKEPKVRCKHRQRPKLHKNELKNLLKSDFERCFNSLSLNHSIIKLKPQFNTLNQKDSLCKNKNNNTMPYTIIRKKLKKGKIRIFDEDLIVKKIMNNFCKFIRHFLVFIQDNSTYSAKNAKADILNKKICSKKVAIDFLKNFKMGLYLHDKNGEILNYKSNFVKKHEKVIYKLLNMSFSDVFQNIFVNSDFFHKYIKSYLCYKFGEDYLNYFLLFIDEVLSGLKLQE